MGSGVGETHRASPNVGVSRPFRAGDIGGSSFTWQLRYWYKIFRILFDKRPFSGLFLFRTAPKGRNLLTWGNAPCW